MKKIARILSITTVTLSCFGGLSGTVAASEYPSKPINMIVGYSAGGGTDVMARTIASHLETYLGEDASVVVRNSPGAGGQIGFTKVAAADPDGYTLGTMNLPAALALTYDREADYDAKSFTWLASFVSDPNTLVVPANSEITSVETLISTARENPGMLTVGLSGLGGNDHFAAIQFAQAANIELNPVPFSGAAMARTSIMGGHVAMGTMAFSQTVGFEEDLRVLAVFADERLAQAPDVPTAKELGFDVEMGSFRGLVAPADLPDDIRETLMSALLKLAEDADFLAAMKKQGSPVQFTPSADYEALAKAQDEAAKHIWEETPWK